MIGLNQLHNGSHAHQICYFSSTNKTLQADLGYSIEPVFKHYRQSLKEGSKALIYLESLGISQPVIERYQLGYSDRTLCLQMASGDTSEGTSLRGFLQSIGLIRPTGHERFWGAVIVPVCSLSGETVAAYGRRFTKALKPRTAIEEFWSTESVPLFNEQCFEVSKELVLCQNPLDALVCLSQGQSNVVATLGLNGLSSDQLDAFSESGIESITLLFENTRSGNGYAGLVAQTLDYLGIVCRRSNLPSGFDLSGYIRHQSDQRSALNYLLYDAQPFRQTMESVIGDIYVS